MTGHGEGSNIVTRKTMKNGLLFLRPFRICFDGDIQRWRQSGTNCENFANATTGRGRLLCDTAQTRCFMCPHLEANGSKLPGNLSHCYGSIENFPIIQFMMALLIFT